MTESNPLHDNTALLSFIQNGSVYGLFGVSASGVNNDSDMSSMPFPLSRPYWDALGYAPVKATVLTVGGTAGSQTAMSLYVNLPDSAPEGLTFTGSLMIYNSDFTQIARKRWSTGPRLLDSYYDSGVDFIGDMGSTGDDLYVGTGDAGNPPGRQCIFSTAGGLYFVSARIDTVSGWPA